MGRTETHFMAGARRAGYAIQPGAALPWLTVRGHLSPGLDAIPTSVIGTLRRIFLALGTAAGRGDERPPARAVMAGGDRCGHRPGRLRRVG